MSNRKTWSHLVSGELSAEFAVKLLHIIQGSRDGVAVSLTHDIIKRLLIMSVEQLNFMAATIRSTGCALVYGVLNI